MLPDRNRRYEVLEGATFQPDRIIRFPRSAVYEQGKVEVQYEILEDDGRVWLMRIRPV